MTNVYSKALDKTIAVDRLIGHIQGSSKGPTIIFIAGVHGNEPSGVFALHKVVEFLTLNQLPIVGNIYAVSGNLWALERGVRYEKEDLNRVWTKKNFERLQENIFEPTNEDANQQLEIYQLIVEILDKEEGPFYFVDLHTTSSETVPFLTVNDSLLNRKYTQQFPVPIILGIEEYLDGPLLSAINNLGYVAFGFEGGQHDDVSSILNHEAFVYLNLVQTGILAEGQINYQQYKNLLIKASIGLHDIFEIYERYEVADNVKFRMKPGFVNFQKIKNGESLAEYDGQVIFSKDDSRILMPLYQNQGNDGYFLIKRIPKFILHWSAFLRSIKLDYFLALLPGIKWASDKKDTLIVDLRVFRFLAKPFFHLLGYRNKVIDQSRMIIRNREKASRTKDYRSAPWV